MGQLAFIEPESSLTPELTPPAPGRRRTVAAAPSPRAF